MSKLPKDLMLAAAMLMTIGGAIGYAQDSGRSGRILGHGNNSCGQYLQAVHGHAPGAPRGIKRPEGEYVDEHERYFDWFTGFISATNLCLRPPMPPPSMSGSGDGASRTRLNSSLKLPMHS
jgi:hypothetical protein